MTTDALRTLRILWAHTSYYEDAVALDQIPEYTPSQLHQVSSLQHNGLPLQMPIRCSWFVSRRGRLSLQSGLNRLKTFSTSSFLVRSSCSSPSPVREYAKPITSILEVLKALWTAEPSTPDAPKTIIVTIKWIGRRLEDSCL